MKGDPPKGSRKGRTCESKWCRNPKALRSDGYLLKHCWKCRSRWLAQHHPITYVMNAMRISARRRGLEFTITRDEFAEFCRDTGYLEKRGSLPHSLTVDRKDHSKGYHIWNIKATKHALNSARGFCVPGFANLRQNMTREEFYEMVNKPAEASSEPF